MTAQVIKGSFDRFRPIAMTLNEDARLSLQADVDILTKIEVWARTRRELTEHVAKPLFPEVRAKALCVLAVIKDQPA